MKNKIYKYSYAIIIGIITMATASASIQLQPNIFNKWNVYMTGNESVLYDISSLTDNLICIKAKNTGLKDITVKEQDLTKPIKDSKTGEILDYSKKDVVYKYPKDITLYTGLEKTEETTKLVTDKDICFTLEPKAEKLFKIGEQSITILGNGVYNSTDTNVTQENLYTHLNLSDGNIMAYFPMDIDARDYSINSNDGTVTEAVLTSGKYGGGYKFDGSNDKIVILNSADVPSLNKTFSGSTVTVSMWLNIGTNGNFIEILDVNADASTNGGFRIEVNKNSEILFELNNRTKSLDLGTGEGFYTRGEWFNLIVTYNGTTASIYKNGILNKESFALSGNLNGSKSNFSIAKGRTGYFNGTIDELMVFNRTLSATEVLKLYAGTYQRFYPNGEQRFIDNNFGTNNTVNITIPNCQQLNGSSIYFDINGNGFSQLNSTCMYDGYNLTGDKTNATVTLKLNSGTYSFYSPLVVGNITLNDYYIDYSIILPYINYYPIYGTRSCFAYNYLKPTGNCTR